MVDADVRPEPSRPVWRRRRQALALVLVVAGGSVAAGALLRGEDDDGFPRAVPETVHEPEPFPPGRGGLLDGELDYSTDPKADRVVLRRLGLLED